MKNKRDMTFTYKGIVCKSETENDDIKLGILYDEQIYFMSISDQEHIYEQLKPNQAGVCIVEYRDGTEPIDFLKAKEVNFEDIFIWIHDLVDITLDGFDGYLLTWVSNGGDPTIRMVDAIEKAFFDNRIIEKIKEHKDYTESWVETH